MERLAAVALELVVVDDGAGLRHDLRDRAGEVDRIGIAGEALDDRRLRMLAGMDQGTRKARSGGLLGGRVEQQVQRLLDDGTGSDFDEGELLEQGGRERRERARGSASRSSSR